ncbi:MAG: hypothetical protein ACOC38_03920 [Promethearchaeia archaeon]
MQLKLRKWNKKDDYELFKEAELDAFKGTLPDAENLTEKEIRKRIADDRRPTPCAANVLWFNTR